MRRVVAALSLAAAAVIPTACGSTHSTSAASVTTPAAATPTTSVTVPATTVSPSTIPTVSTVPATTSTSRAAAGACISGDWTSTLYAQQAKSATTTGGAGIKFVIDASELSIDFTGMQPISFNQGGVAAQGIYAGQEHATFLPRPVTSTSGTFALSAGTSDVTFQGFQNGRSFGAPIKASGFPADGVNGTWVCSGSDTASLTVPTPDGPTTVSMARQM
jgi:hypothetical protein